MPSCCCSISKLARTGPAWLVGKTRQAATASRRAVSGLGESAGRASVGRWRGPGRGGGEDAQGALGPPPCGERTGGIGGQAFVGELAREGDGVLPGGVRGLAGGVGGAADGDFRGAERNHSQG